jgi:hypothetical protein
LSGPIEQRVKLLRVDTLHQMSIGVDLMAVEQRTCVAPVKRRYIQELFDRRGCGRQYRL